MPGRGVGFGVGVEEGQTFWHNTRAARSRLSRWEGGRQAEVAEAGAGAVARAKASVRHVTEKVFRKWKQF